MAKIQVPIQVNLPDNWMDLVLERIKEDGDWQLVVRCKDCRHWKRTTQWCAELCIDTLKYNYCSRGERRVSEEPEINPCRGCEDYDGEGGCKSHGGC